MSEYLDLRTTLTQEAIADTLRERLPADLVSRLHVHDGTVTTKLATGNDVFFSFDEIVALYGLAQEGPFQYGPGHEQDATPEDILLTRASLYLGAWEERGERKKRVLIAADIANDLSHRDAWWRTKPTVNNNGTWYDLKV